MNMNRSAMEMPTIGPQDLLCEARVKELRERHPEFRSCAAGNAVRPSGRRAAIL